MTRWASAAEERAAAVAAASALEQQGREAAERELLSAREQLRSAQRGKSFNFWHFLFFAVILLAYIDVLLIGIGIHVVPSNFP